MKDCSIYGQKPKLLVIACSDYRVDPAILLNCVNQMLICL